MQLEALVLSAALPLAGAVAAAVLSDRPREAVRVGYGAAALGSLVLLVAALVQLRQPGPIEGLLWWQLPLGSARFGTDPLSAWLLVLCSLVTLPAALAGIGASDSGTIRRPVLAVIAFDLLLLGIIGTLLARDLVLLLMAWEVMAGATFLSVALQGRGSAGRRAAWTYLVATQLGTMPLLVLVLTIRGQSGTTFPTMGALATLPAATKDLLLVLAILGCGAKAGLVPLHLWLPEAHPAAPAHVSAVLSGVMVTTGIYLLLRVISWLGEPPLWWGLLLLALGLASAVLGVAQALAQAHLKRLLAYSTVENVGLMVAAIGIALIGAAAELPTLVSLALAAALWMTLGHGLAKALLFLGAGALIDGSRVHSFDRMGGLLRRMPLAGSALLLGAAALLAIPPLGGFVGELVLVLALLQVGTHPPLVVALALVISLGVIGLVGGLAIATFASALGSALLGEPRSTAATRSSDVGGLQRLALVLLCGMAVGMALIAPLLLTRLGPVLGEVVESPSLQLALDLQRLQAPLLGLMQLSALVGGLSVLLLLLRRRLLRDASVRRGLTWDCGYAAPTARMQYTATSLSAPLALGMGTLSGLSPPPAASSDLFPDLQRLRIHRSDPLRVGFFAPLLRATTAFLGRLVALQQGKVQLYVLSIVLTLVALLALGV